MSSHPPQHHDGRHPTFKQYVVIAIILFVITAIEFAIIVPDQLRGHAISIPPLVILSALKFAIVVMFYMHLKFDSRTFTVVFVAGLALAFMVGAAVLGLFGSFQPEPRSFAAANAVPYLGHGVVDGPHETGEPSPPEAGEAPAPPPPPESGPGDLVDQGQTLFTGKGTCNVCHTIEGVSSGMVGPDLTHIGTDADTRKPDMSASEYLHESIRQPEAFVATGVERAIPGVMTTALTSSLSDQEVTALVEFLLAQK
jgi:heme/copper-type cytochrome/quinol oxidase subunit 4/mono/diheme cytochrome c family protein